MLSKNTKIRLKLLLRFCCDLSSGHYFKMAKKGRVAADFKHSLVLTQEIKKNENFDSKIQNLKIAADKINLFVILPNEIFSFWKIIGNPNIGFAKGRTIRKGKIETESGGGLCQASGILHQLSLIAGLQVLERHNHSVDIYTEVSRFCPLGSDATVVYGYKDLRIKNIFSFPIAFQMQISDAVLSLTLLSTEKINEKKINFHVEKLEGKKLVTVSDESGVLYRSEYLELAQQVS